MKLLLDTHGSPTTPGFPQQRGKLFSMNATQRLG